MKPAALLLTLCLCGCASRGELETHYAKVRAMRAKLPYETQIGKFSHSMITVLEPGSIHTVHQFPYGSLHSGFATVYWPVGFPSPICHFTNERVGTDSWSTKGMEQADDLLYLGVLLTRENYIGVIW